MIKIEGRTELCLKDVKDKKRFLGLFVIFFIITISAIFKFSNLSKEDINSNNIICIVAVRPYMKNTMLYTVYENKTVNIKECFTGENIKSEDFVIDVYSNRNRKMKKNIEKIDELIKRLYSMDENKDYGYAIDDGEDVKVLIKNKSYWSGGRGISLYSNKIYDETIQDLAEYIEESIKGFCIFKKND